MHRLSFRAGLQPQSHQRPVLQQRAPGNRVAQQRELGHHAKRLSFRCRLPRQQEDDPQLYPIAAVLHRRHRPYRLNTFNSWPLSNGSSVTFGLPWFNSGSPCSAPLKNGIANPVCNGYLQLQPLSARQHIHPDRAAQPDVVVAEVARLQRPIPVQPRQFQHAVARNLLRADYQDQQLLATTPLAARRIPGGTRRRPMFPPRFTSTINCDWSRRSASATSAWPEPSSTRKPLISTLPALARARC